MRELEVALDGRTPNAWRLRALAARAGRYRPGALVAISGLDGSGKSTQAEGLEHALNALGYPVVRVWTSLSAHPSLARVAAPVRTVLRHRRESSGKGQQRPSAGEDSDPLTHLREGNPLLQRMWIGFVAIMNAWWVLRAVRPHLLRGRIVICDRYTLDSIIHLRYRYGAERHYRAHLSLIRLLSPTPLRAYLLDIAPETAYARNQEYTRGQIELRARLYREEHAGLDVLRRDGERPPEELCQQLALEVWSALREERDAVASAPLRRLGVLSGLWRR
jgi:thymidylate kinase